MTEILLRCLLLSLITIGICYPFWDDMIFEKVGDWIKQTIGNLLYPGLTKLQRYDKGEWIAKPLFACYVCATFWYSLIICLCIGWPWWYCVPAMGISAIVSQLSHD